MLVESISRPSDSISILRRYLPYFYRFLRKFERVPINKKGGTRLNKFTEVEGISNFSGSRALFLSPHILSTEYLGVTRYAK